MYSVLQLHWKIIFPFLVKSRAHAHTFPSGAHKTKERVTSMLGVMKHCQGFCGVWVEEMTYPNKASFGASSVSKLALFEYVTSFPLPRPIKILTMLHQVVTRSFFMGSCSHTKYAYGHETLQGMGK